MERRTIRSVLAIQGVGLHRGAPITLNLRPGSQGIVFIRDGVRLAATPDNNIDTRLNTTLGNATLSVSTIEHLMSALYGLSVTDCDIEADGDEMPSLDGSALPFFLLLKETGTEPLGMDCPPITLSSPVRVGGEKAWIEAMPGEFGITYEIDFPDPAIGSQRFSFTGRDYEGLIAPARTFGRMQDVEMMRSAGLALGGGLHNAVVVDHDRVLNPEGLRFPDEFVRHKVLDILGDLWTLQAPLEARVKAFKANHTLHIALARRISEMRHKGRG